MTDSLKIKVQDTDKKSALGIYLEDELKKICLLEAKDIMTEDEAIEMYCQMKNELFESVADIESVIEEQAMAERWEQETLAKTKEVICPVCQKENLEESGKSMIVCKNHNHGMCQFKFNAASSGVRDLDDVAERLQAALQKHPCSEVPKFLFRFLDEADHSSSLLFYCESCGFMQKIF